MPKCDNSFCVYGGQVKHKGELCEGCKRDAQKIIDNISSDIEGYDPKAEAREQWKKHKGNKNRKQEK